MKFSHAVLIALVLAPWTALRAADAPLPARPNIIFILADDLGVGNVGCYGSDHYQTPHIDQLASGGVRYTHAYTAPLCGPSRTLIMTGRYAFRTGATNQDRVGELKPSDETMLPKLLKAAGYVSSAVGKWSQFPGQPSDWGFDDYLRFSGSGVYWNTKAKGEPYVVNGESKTLREKQYMPDVMHQHVVDFVTRHRDEPFFVYYSLSSVHGELHPTPDSEPTSKDMMGDNVAYMDKLVGKLVAELERLKQRDKTLIVFMGDNGTGKGQADRATIGGQRLSGQKGTMLEGGALVPLIVNWPGVMPQGKVASGVVDSTDFVPTFGDLARVKLPTNLVLDGVSLAAQWCGGSVEPRNWAFVQLARNWYVREASWKLNQAGELFDMRDAPFDEKLVAVDKQNSDATAARKRLQAVLDRLNPAGGILDDGDGTGRHANKDKDKKKKSASDANRAGEPPEGTRTQAARPQKPNVLFIAVDDMRPELGCYGNKVVKTPQIDRLAARGIVFERAYCLQAVCSPSRTAILTGLRPDTTKVWDLETHFRAALPDCVTLPQHFKANGYHCSSLGKIYHGGFEDGRSWNEPHWYPKGRAVDTDLDDWSKQIVTTHNVTTEEYATPDVGRPKDAKGRTKRGPAYEVSPKQDDELPDGATAGEAVKRIQALKAKAQPFFLAVGFLKPHLPFVAPKKYWDLYDPHAIPVPATDKLPEGCPSFAGHTNGELHNYPGVPTQNPIPDEFARTLRHGYYACLSYTDAQIGRLLDALEQTGQLDNTIIVLWGDHGWQLGEHGLWHKHTNFEVAARSPLLISVPKTKTAGQKCTAPVEFVDVSPTLTDLCGLPAQPGLAGLSLKRYIDSPAAPMQKVAISQYPRSAGPGSGQVMGYSIRNERFRATFWRERKGSQIVATELYDEQNDPHETVNLAEKPEHQELLAALQKHLPPVGSDTPPAKKGPTPQPVTKATAPVDETRDARFTRLYPGKQKLTLPEYLAAQGKDVAAATERFKKMDKNGDGSLTRAEFVGESKQN